MNPQLAIVLAFLATAVAMFAINRPRMDVVGLLVMAGLPLTGIIRMSEALAGFSESNIVLIALLFVIGEGLVQTGVAQRMGDWVIARTGRREAPLIILIMVCVCGLGSFMSSTAVTAIFIPVALRIARVTGSAPGRLMMPLCFAALISGMMTLVATAPNLVVNGELVRQGHGGFGFFSFTPFGVPILALGIGYMLIVRRWLRAKPDPDAARAIRAPSLLDWIERYKLADREHRLLVPERSSLVGRRLGELQLRSTAGANILAIERATRTSRDLVQPTEQTVLHAGDILLIDLATAASDAGRRQVEELRTRFALEELPMASHYFTDRSQEIGMAEVVVPPDSDLVGRTLAEAQFRTRTDVTVIGLRRGKEALETNIPEERLRAGDALLVIGRWKHIERLQPDDSGVLLLRLPIEMQEVVRAPGKAIQAVFCLALVVFLMVTGWIPNVQAALIGCLLMGALGCIDLASAYRSINWKTIILIVGMLPFSLALGETGGVDLAAGALDGLTSDMGIRGSLAALFAVTAALGMFISNTATAVLMAPVALALAEKAGASPYPFAMTVALAASTAFITPVSSPVNTLVVAPGNYTFGDFVRVGTPFALLVMIVTISLVPLLLPP